MSSPAAEEPAQTPEVAAERGEPDASGESDGATAADTPTGISASLRVNEPATDQLNSVATVTPTESMPDDAETVPPPTSITVAAPPPDVRDPVPAPGCGRASATEAGSEEAAHGQPRNQAVADCVARWLKGEVEEFRDGVKREIGEFRAGFDTVRRALQRFGSKVGSPQ
jgi:hypothetical protein